MSSGILQVCVKFFHLEFEQLNVSIFRTDKPHFFYHPAFLDYFLYLYRYINNDSYTELRTTSFI